MLDRLARLNCLRFLKLSSHSLGTVEAITAVARMVSTLARANLEDLELSDCALGDAGTLALLSVLPTACKLKTLGLHTRYRNVNNSHMTEVSAVALLDALPRLPNLKVLGVNGQEEMMDSEAGKALLEAAKKAGIEIK